MLILCYNLPVRDRFAEPSGLRWAAPKLSLKDLGGPTEETEPVSVCLDADVLIAGPVSRTGANHAILVLGEVGLLRLVLPEAARSLTSSVAATGDPTRRRPAR